MFHVIELRGGSLEIMLDPGTDFSAEATALAFLGRYDALPRGAELDRLCRNVRQPRLQLGRQPDVVQHQPGLPCQVGEEPLLAGRDWLTELFSHSDFSNRLTAI